MFLGKVVGSLWSTVKWPALSGHKLLIVQPCHLADLGTVATSPPPPAVESEAVVCVDLLDAGIGDHVLVAFGHAARVAAESVEPAKPSAPSSPPTTTPVDAAIVAIVDRWHVQ